MFLGELILSLLLALLLVALLVPVGGYRTRRGEEAAGVAFLVIFLIMFPLIWAGGLWLTPIGAPIAGISWLSFLVVALLIALLFAAILPRYTETPVVTDDPAEEVERVGATAAFGAFFFILFALLVLAIVLAYV